METGGEEKMVTEKPWLHVQSQKTRNSNTDGVYWLLGGPHWWGSILFQKVSGMIQRKNKDTHAKVQSPKELPGQAALTAGSWLSLVTSQWY